MSCALLQSERWICSLRGESSFFGSGQCVWLHFVIWLLLGGAANATVGVSNRTAFASSPGPRTIHTWLGARWKTLIVDEIIAPESALIVSLKWMNLAMPTSIARALVARRGSRTWECSCSASNRSHCIFVLCSASRCTCGPSLCTSGLTSFAFTFMGEWFSLFLYSLLLLYEMGKCFIFIRFNALITPPLRCTFVHTSITHLKLSNRMPIVEHSLRVSSSTKKKWRSQQLRFLWRSIHFWCTAITVFPCARRVWIMEDKTCADIKRDASQIRDLTIKTAIVRCSSSWETAIKENRAHHHQQFLILTLILYCNAALGPFVKKKLYDKGLRLGMMEK
jgi:hypothetical protein